MKTEMKKINSPKVKKRKSVVNDQHSTKCSRLNNGMLSTNLDSLPSKYFCDTVPEEAVRSSLPSELADEYLSFVQQCDTRKRKDDISNILKKSQDKEQSCNNGNKLSADQKENLPAERQPQKSGSSKKGPIKRGRRRKNTIRNLLKCLICSKEFPTKQAKQDHHDDHLGPKGYECTFCVKAFEKMPALVSHVSRIHLIDKKLSCKICGKKFRREWLLRSHSLIHTSGRKFSCPVCKMGFTHKRYLFEHISGHVGFNPYKCEECGKRFQKSSYLSLHRKIHVRVRPFKCKLCNIQCSLYSAIELHTLLHTKSLGFECSDCNVRIPSTTISEHLASHTRKKNLRCNLCPAKFYAKSTLRDHLKAHSYLKEYSCDVCKKILHNLSDCSDHICPKWEEDDNVVFCPLCKTHIKKDLLDGHNSKWHSKESSAKSTTCDDTDDDDLCDESGESVSFADNGHRKNSDRNFEYDELEDQSDSSSNDYMSDESDVDDPDEEDCVSERDTLDLNCGLVQQMRQIQNEVEEDDFDDDSDDADPDDNSDD